MTSSVTSILTPPILRSTNHHNQHSFKTMTQVPAIVPFALLKGSFREYDEWNKSFNC